MTKISFSLWGLTLLEPMALVMNWLLALFSIVQYYTIRREGESKFAWYWGLFFLFFAGSTFLGGLSHLFFKYIGMMGKIPGWGMALLGVACIELAVASAVDNRKVAQFLKAFSGIKMLCSIIMLTIDLRFEWVLVHTALGLVGILGYWSIAGMINGREGYSYFAMGVLVLLLGLPFRIFAWDLHLWFNRDDAGHVLMLIAVFLFGKGVMIFDFANPTMATRTSQ